jgi:hypothetical protein
MEKEYIETLENSIKKRDVLIEDLFSIVNKLRSMVNHCPKCPYHLPDFNRNEHICVCDCHASRSKLHASRNNT